MTTRITIIKSQRQADTYRNIDMQSLADIIRNQEYQGDINELRSLYPILKMERGRTAE